MTAGALLIGLGALIATAPAESPSKDVPDVNDLSWMAGCWEQRDGERWTEECWTAPRGGLMLGSSRAGRGDTVSEWEVLRIERDARNGDGPAVRLGYWASPGGQGWTLFGASEGGAAGVVFFNVANDYPQRIRYWREGDELIAEIALADGGKAQAWRYRRVRP